MAKIYTKRGDDGTTSLFDGTRVPKTDRIIELLGAIDESQAFLGLARSEASPGGELDEVLTACERDLWIVMAEVATPESATRTPGTGEVAAEMVAFLEETIDRHVARTEVATSFAVPGENRCSAALDVARTVVRRAERLAVAVGVSDEVKRYLNRLSDLIFVLARANEQEHPLNTSKADS